MFLSEVAAKSKMLDYHSTLSTKIWDGQELKREVLLALRRIAKEFIETLGVSEEAVADIIITGSLCNYNYTRYSDIDLHIVLDYSLICDGCEGFSLDDCMKAKKSLWNDRHDITIYGMDVELYAQDVTDTITGNAGIFSIKRNEWVRVPKKLKNVDYDERMVMDKAKHIMSEIDSIIEDKVDDSGVITKLLDKIKNMRKSGLERAGEFSMENLVFKILRNSGYMEKLYDYQLNMKSKDLSLE